MPLEWIDFRLALEQFLHAGGWVLYLILGLCVLLWSLLLERLWFKFRVYPQLRGALSRALAQARQGWQRQSLRCDLELALSEQLPLIKTLIALCPLVGLLGTVTGMIQVFDALALNGTGNPRLMAAGVARATLPTLAGMVVAVSGLLIFNRLQRWSDLEKQRLQAGLQEGAV
ncbi:MotA/TolQ/ExbB proton channel family protein [Marinobacterium arenosum]|uniref:MotA/TolQ/ExbB proton channel family protein n=1 Tax=Marinobacterium arenosum TaxID=2862496 RepID=UPI001C93B545|nr:MotA/TolQ/ExbB proton channel family protein [Marinobacterium arenosum]MBY4678247.1 MotA/TolQ/ExbB proton channel family protein [Marinobacterium arenosum]